MGECTNTGPCDVSLLTIEVVEISSSTVADHHLAAWDDYVRLTRIGIDARIDGRVVCNEEVTQLTRSCIANLVRLAGWVHDGVTRFHAKTLAVAANRALARQDVKELPLCRVRMIRATCLARREYFERDVERMPAVRGTGILLRAERE